MKRKEIILLMVVGCLIVFGALMIFSSSAVLAKNKFGYSCYFLVRQLIFLGVGCVAMAVCRRIDYHWWAKLCVPLLFINLLLLVMVLVPGFGRQAGGATRWLHTPIFYYSTRGIV